MAQKPVTVGTVSVPVSLDTNFSNIDDNFDELYATYDGAIEVSAGAGITISSGGEISVTAGTYEAITPSSLNLTSDTSISSAQLLANKFITNQGATTEIDLTLPAVSYRIVRTILVEESQIIELNPPSGEAFDLNGTLLDADDVIDSPATVGAKAVITRMQNASGGWHWSVDSVRGTWEDSGASD